jgi:hypothetical protein
VKREMLMAAAIATGATGIVAACSDSIVEGGLPLTVSITADRTVAEVGDSVVYSAEATGANLVGLALDFGDGAVDSTAASGAVRAGVTRAHVYGAAGTYVAKATAVDVQGLLVEVTDSVSVQIIEPGG